VSDRVNLGRVGIWSRQLRYGDPAEALEAAAELEQLGYGTLWIPGGEGGPLLETVGDVLAATTRVAVATGILNVWGHDAFDVAAGHARLDAEHPGRFLLGLGVGHAPIVDATQPGRYRMPLSAMRSFLDELDANAPAGQRPARVLAALAPRMIELAAERTLGAHPYLVPVEHTREVRRGVGPEMIVAPELSVVLDADVERARDIARRDLELYLGLPNYTTTWRRLGYGDADLTSGGSEALIDALYALGSSERIAARIREHLDAGADHVCLRVATSHPDDAVRLPREEWRALAPAVVGF
jgi:probable F420-dependent oxidoreductase